MPIYEYKCSKCDHQFEQLVKSMNAQADVACPGCGSKKAEKQLSVFAARQAQPAASAMPPGCGGCAQAGSCPMME
jgi:putative FmdB family regulatory protein